MFHRAAANLPDSLGVLVVPRRSLQHICDTGRPGCRASALRRRFGRDTHGQREYDGGCRRTRRAARDGGYTRPRLATDLARQV